jgi:hypothetical protein
MEGGRPDVIRPPPARSHPAKRYGSAGPGVAPSFRASRSFAMDGRPWRIQTGASASLRGRRGGYIRPTAAAEAEAASV